MLFLNIRTSIMNILKLPTLSIMKSGYDYSN